VSADPLLERVSRALVDRYAVVRELGSGGMGTVYLATDRALGREVAIKVLPPSTREYLGADRFQRELRIAARLSHPHIVPLYEAGEADGLLYYVMAYVPGETLADRLRREGALPLAEALRLTSEVGDALQYAHEQGVIHRDVKPSNILLSRDHAFLMDFGVAKAMSGDSGTGPALTGTGVVVGTAEYMSPEQAAGEKRIDARTDVYAIAAVLYEMLTGEPPFTGPSLQAIVARVISDPPRPIHTIRPDLPPHVERALAAALAKTPADRPATARQFGDLLAQPAERPIRRMPGWAWLGGGAAIALVGGLVWWALGGRHRAAAPAPAELGPPSGMVLVPGGEYLVGGATGRAQRRVRLDSFYLDSTEVTVAAYGRYLAATGRAAPWGTVPDSAWPVTAVLWTEADAYCRWRDALGRLPGEDEWEAAARGPTGRQYPWGDAWAPGRANADGIAGTLAPPATFPLGRSWVGAVDLVGNAWEWTAGADTGPGAVRHVIKGGGFDSPPENVLPAFRAVLPDDRTALANTGFRCARAVAP
jgi:formylglycine-generating enzyme required for sulfatase activity